MRLFRALPVAVLLAALPCRAAAQVRVACLGDSITYGARIEDRDHHTYPARLQHRLGARYEVRNFGLTGRALRQGADLPLVEEPLFQEAVAWRPDVAIVLLGTNDTFLSPERPNWVEGHDFGPDLRALTGPLHAANPDLRVIIATSPPIDVDQPGLDPRTVREMRASIPRLAQVRAQLRRIARATPDYEFVDLARLLSTGDYSDGYHPTPFGADRIATRMAAAVEARLDPGPSTLERLEDLKVLPVERGERFGLVTARFVARGERMGDVFSTTIIQPERALEGRPWVLREGPLKERDAWYRDLVERGFHLAIVEGEGPAARDAVRRQLEEVGFGAPLELGVQARGTDRASQESALRAALRAAGQRSDEARPTTAPCASVEHRPSAGWGEGRAWHEAAEDLRTMAREIGSVDVLLLGGATVQELASHRDRLARPDGERPLDRFARHRRVAAFGLQGEGTQHLLHRVERGDLDPLAPRLVVVHTGLHNLTEEMHTAAETAEGIRVVTEALRKRFPEAHLLTCGPFPTIDGSDPALDRTVAAVHLELAKGPAVPGVTHLDLSRQMRGHGARLGAVGGPQREAEVRQRIWLDALLPSVDELLGF